MGYTPKSTKQWLSDLWLRVDKNGPRAGRLGRCWIWQVGKYGGPTEKEVQEGLLHPATNYGPYVLFWELANGSVPRGMLLHHKCFNPPCVRASHLEPLTRGAHASHHQAAALAERQQRLRATLVAARPIRQADVASLVGISAAHLNELVTGKQHLSERRLEAIMSAIAAKTKEARRATRA